MALFRILLLAFIFSGVFKFITRILIPLLKMRSAVKDQIKTQQQAQNQQSQTKAPKNKQKSSSVGEYIDFEEIK